MRDLLARGRTTMNLAVRNPELAKGDRIRRQTRSLALAAIVAAAPIHAANLVQNGSFNGSLSGWDVVSLAGSVASYSPANAVGPPSGSALFATPYTSTVEAFSQCIAAPADGTYEVGAQL